MPDVDAIVFDLFETLVTEYDPQWKPGPSIASRLGVSDEDFTRVWQSRHAERMTSAVDFREVLRDIWSAGSTGPDVAMEQIVQSLYTERLAAKARPQAVMAKPDPAIYRRALDDLGVMPSQVAFVGDGGSDELAGAAAVGMRSFCAMWFLNRWPVVHRSRHAERRHGFPRLNSPADLPVAFERTA